MMCKQTKSFFFVFVLDWLYGDVTCFRIAHLPVTKLPKNTM